MDNTNGMPAKPRNPVGRPRIHPRYPIPTPARRTTYIDNDPDEIEEVEEIDRDDPVRDRDWVNRQQDDRLPWSKRTNSTVNNYSPSSMPYQRNSGPNSYRNIRQPLPFQQRPTRGQFHQTQFVKPEPTRKATIPFLQPAFAPNASTQYPRDQPLPRLKPGTVRTRGRFFSFKEYDSYCFLF